MKKKRYILVAIGLVLLVSILLTGCAKFKENQVREQLELGNQYLLEMDYENAIVAFEKAIELDDKNPAVYMALGEAYSEIANYMEETQSEDDEVFEMDSLSCIEKAIEVYEQAEQLNGKDGDIAIGLAGLYDQMGNYYINHFSEENAPAAYETARGYYEQAVERYNKILEDDPENINAITGIAEASNKLGDYYTADEDYENAKEIYESANEHCELAIEICKELLETDPNNQTVAEQLGNLYIETGNIKEWLELAEKYPQIDSGEREEYREIADVTDKIAALCEQEDYLGAAGLMADDQFMACWNFVREQKNPFFINFGDKKMGIYYTRNRGSYIYQQDCFVYYGDYETNLRHGAGAWLWNTKTSPSEWSGYMSSDFCEYFAGEWANDKPNGTQKQENPDFTRTGNVVNGLWDGVVMHEEYDENESVLERYPITFHNGKVEVLRIKADHGALTDYVISEEVTTGEEYLVLSSSYPDGNYGVDGFTD